MSAWYIVCYPQSTMRPVIETYDLIKVFDGGIPVHALRGVTIKIQPGTFVSIMGPSGSGKSTLLHIIGALDGPTDGRVLIDGTETKGLSDDELTVFRRTRIGFVFQQFNLVPIFNLVENVALPLRLAGKSAAEANARGAELLAMVGLAGRERSLPSQISGGEQQRVAIARALAPRPAIVLADEPTGSVDTENGKRLVQIFRELVDEHQHTVVLVTHDPSVAASSDRVIYMRDGLIHQEHEPGETLSPDASIAELKR